MNPRPLASLLAAFALPWALSAQTRDNSPVAALNPAAAAGQAEVQTIASGHDAAKRDDDKSVDAQLRAAGKGEWAEAPSSLLLVRRTAAVCGWLCNDNDYGRAMKLADRVIRQIAQSVEKHDAERAERLYWEAWLEARILDHKARAVDLLKVAEKLTPKDDRITGLELELVAALAEFGR